MSPFYQAFHVEIDKLSIVQMCYVCLESYPGIVVFRRDEGPICVICRKEHDIHCFSQDSNMNPHKQPTVLSILTQVEEILIARVNPILQVTHARGGQYKYNGHTISFPQDIISIVTTLPRRIEELDILIVRKKRASLQVL